MNNIIKMEQVHGSNVKIVGKKDIGKTIPNCDGLITNEKGVTLMVKTADCLPIILKDTKNGEIGIIHAGWRGLKKEILKNAINLMSKTYGTNPNDLIVGIGPHICGNCYEVKEDVAKFFTETKIKNGKKYLDLEKVAINQLIKLEVKERNIKIDNRCTFEDINLPSYRRDKTSKRLALSIWSG